MQALAKAIVEQAPDSVLATDAHGRIVYVNARVEEMFGYVRSELLGQPVEVLLPEHVRKRHVEDRIRYVADPYVRQMKEDRLLAARRKNGTEFPAGISIGPVTTPEGILVVCFIRDMTRVQQIENRLSQVQKMEAIGHLAGGIAHDFNNLLTIINGHSEELFRSLRADFRACQRVQEIAKAGERAASLTRQLLAFSRQQILAPRTLCLNDLVTDFHRMAKRLLGEPIKLVLSLSPELGNVKADAGQIEHVLMNLVVNARDAMPAGGGITIETKNVEMHQGSNGFRPEMLPGRYALLLVRDNGCGMDQATLARIFEPFFTTKPVGKGAGLGLATAYGIVKQSNGYIYADSQLGQGTSFRIYLPLIDDPNSVLQAELTPVQGGVETVLMVEDEEGVLDLLRSTLEDAGYKVLHALCGQDALCLARYHVGPIHLLLTDVVMPEMSGRALAEQLSALHPKARVLYMSGHTDDVILRQGVEEATANFIGKPFSLDDLLRKIRAVLGPCGTSKDKPRDLRFAGSRSAESAVLPVPSLESNQGDASARNRN
ncbi:MAG TPA: PAS domain S-box protein [Gemmataceae bacterium]|nr:PAS domain S-box protein [Gemmataceae bacterium]